MSAAARRFPRNAYYRDIRTNTLNGDINEDSLDQAIYQPSAAERAALAAAGYTGVPASGADATNTPFPSWRCIGNVLLNDEPAEKCNGLINRTRTVQHNGGASGQLMLRDELGDRRNNQFTVGAAYDRSRVGFVQSTELGYLNPDRSVTGVNAFGDGGVTGGECRRRAVRRPRRSRRADPHLEPLRDRHPVDRQRLACHPVRTLQPRRPSTIAIASSPAADRARSTAITRSADSTRRQA